MSLARQYNNVFRKQLAHYAAWNPVTDLYEVGDFGELRQGVFVKLGHVREFGVSVESRPGNAKVEFSFASKGTKVVRAAGGVTVDVFPNQAVTGSLSVGFDGEHGEFIKASQVEVIEMQAVDATAYQLHGKRDSSGRKWDVLNWVIVRKVYIADGPTILLSASKNGKFELGGKADALKSLDLGNASADISVKGTQANSFSQIGGKGPIALDLFRVKLSGRAVSFALEAEPEADDSDDATAYEVEDVGLDDDDDDDA